MTLKLTSKPVKDELVVSHLLVYGVHDLEKTFRSSLCATLGIQRFALVLLLVSTVDPDETAGFALRVSKLDMEFLVGLFEMCDSGA